MPNARQPPKSVRADLARIARATAAGLISVADAATVLNSSRADASKRLAALTKAGWLERVRRGHYVVLPLEASSGKTTTFEDPWVMAAALYAPCYVAGWTAAEHWGLTEQLFRSTFVATSSNIRDRQPEFMGAAFHLVRVKATRISNLLTVWRGSTRVSISSPERTIVDAAIEPSWVGGFRHLKDIFSTYIEDGAQHEVLSELHRSGTGAAAKRIGFLTQSLWPKATDLMAAAYAMKSTGIIKLEPSSRRRGRMNTRWGVWVNVG